MNEYVIIRTMYNEGRHWNGQKAKVVRRTGDIVVVTGLSGTYGAECIFWNYEVENS